MQSDLIIQPLRRTVVFSGVGRCEISIFLKFMAVNNLTLSFYIWVTFDNNAVILLSSSGKTRFAGLTAAVCALRYKLLFSHPILWPDSYFANAAVWKCLPFTLGRACLHLKTALKVRAHLTNSSIDLTVQLIDKAADAQRSLRRDQIYSLAFHQSETHGSG